MAISPADCCLDDEQEQTQIMSLTTNLATVEDDEVDDDKGLEEDLKALRARVEALHDEDDVLPAERWDWAEGVEAGSKQAVERLAQEEEAIQRACPRRRCCRTCQARAARVGVLRAEAEEVGAAARRLREADLRKLAADAETGEYSYVLILTHEELAAAARLEFLAVAMEKRMASLASRLNRGVAEFAGRPGEEAFVAAMRMEAAKADDARAAIARYRAAAGSLPPSAAAAGDQTMEQD